jgi:plastocyanin
MSRFALAMPFVVIAVTVCGEPSGQGNGCQSTGADVIIIAQGSNNAFDKPSLTIGRGQTVCWQISGAAAHTVTADPATPADSNWIVVNGTLNASTVVRYTFSRAGVYPYHCAIHVASSNMRGTITVP